MQCLSLAAKSLLFLGVISAANAATPAGTVISNTATIVYTYGGSAPVSQQTNSSNFRVLQLIDVAVQAAEVGPVIAGSPDPQRAITFLVTNSGNGPDQIRLSRVDAISGDQFDPLPAGAAIYIESGATPGLQLTGANADTPYVAGSNDLQLLAGESKRVYILSAIPANLANGAQGRVELRAASTLAGAAGTNPGTTASAVRIAGLEAIVGASRAQASSQWLYQVSGLQVRIDKDLVKVLDPSGGNQLIPGSVMTYRLSVKVVGSGVANDITVSDPLPAQMKFKAGSIRVGTVSQTDARDADFAQFDGAQVLAQLGNLSAPTQVDIEFDTILQ